MSKQVVLISGATGGIGRATVKELAGMGATLVLTARNQDALNTLAHEVEQAGTFALPLAADLTRPDDMQTLLKETLQECERLDAVVIAHGVGHLADGFDLAEAEVARMLDVNVMGTFRLVQAAAQAMRGSGNGGRIVLLPGTMGTYTMQKAAGYAASRWAQVGMAKALAQDFRRYGIAFTLIYLGGVDTPLWDGMDMRVQRDKMLRPADAARAIRFALEQPAGGVVNEITVQPESHQLF
jgi:NADP-dependent 3-hydroxy acid dehydrogenase YdfG